MHVPGLSDDEGRTLNRLLENLKELEPRNRLRQRLYDNKELANRSNDIIPREYHHLGITVGWISKAVDALARRCTIEGFTWPDGDLGSLGAVEVWEGNNLRARLNSAMVSSLIHGPSFLVNTTGGAGEPSAMIHVRDAVNSTGTWNRRTERLDDFLTINERDDRGNPSSMVLYLPNLTIGIVREGGKWSVERTPHAFGIPVEPLVYKGRVGREFGSSRITRPLVGLQWMGVRALIRTEGHSDVFSYPDFWLLGATAESIKGADGSNVAAMRAELGRIRGIPDVGADDPKGHGDALDRADIKQFPASAPTPNLAVLNAVAKLFAREASLPDSALAITDFANPTSGDSYDASQYELIAEAEGALEDWKPAIRRSYIRALTMANNLTTPEASWETIGVRERSARYTSRAAAADAGLKQLQAMPWLADTEVGLELLGLSDDQIRRALAERRRAEGRSILDALRAADDGDQS